MKPSVTEKLPEIPIVIVVIRATTGELFVHQRRDEKPQYSGLFGLGAGGRVEPGESPERAARRELLEETGLEASVKSLFELEYCSDQAAHRMFVFEHLTDAEPQHDMSEWRWCGWLMPRQVERLYRQGQLCPDTASVFERYCSLSN